MTTVTVYGAPGCHKCRMTENEMSKHGIQYTKVDVSQDQEALNYIQSLGYKMLPVVVKGEEHWSDFQPQKIRALAH